LTQSCSRDLGTPFGGNDSSRTRRAVDLDAVREEPLGRDPRAKQAKADLNEQRRGIALSHARGARHAAISVGSPFRLKAVDQWRQDLSLTSK